MIWVLAFSIQDQVEKYGAYIGIASFLGLALLSVLYFAQAREVRRLRDWAGRAPERDRELEERVSADAARRVQTPAPAAAPVAEQVAEPEPVNGHGRPAGVPMGPRPATAAALVAAAVSSAAAPVEVAGEEDAAGGEPPRDEGDATVVREPAGDDAPAGHESAPAGEESAPAPAPGEPAQAPAASEEPPVAQEPAAAPVVTNGHGDHETDEHAVATAGALPPIPRATPRQGPRRPAQPLRNPQRSATLPPRRTPPARPRARAAAPPPRRSEGSRPGTGLLIGGALAVLVVAVIVVFATGVLGGSSSPATRGGSPAATPSATPAPSSPAARAGTTVVVLNGTTVDGLAASEKAKLEQIGYHDVQTTTSENQAEQQSTVAYASGERRQALDVARVLGIGDVKPLDPDTQSLANNSFAKPVQADVVVVVGADQAP